MDEKGELFYAVVVQPMNILLKKKLKIITWQRSQKYLLQTRSTDGAKISEQKFLKKEDLHSVNVFPKIIIHFKGKNSNFSVEKLF